MGADEDNFKTFHVTVQPKGGNFMYYAASFQDISCYCSTTSKGIPSQIVSNISRHFMLLFNKQENNNRT